MGTHTVVVDETPAGVDEIQAEPTDAQADADFEAGYADPTDAPTGATPPAIVDPADSTTPESEPDTVPVPEFVQLTKESHQQLLDGVAQIDTIKAALEDRFGKVFGTMGGLQRTLKQIQDATPSGQAVELSNEDLKELAEDFPELTGKMLTGLNRAMSKLKGTGPAAVNPDQISTLVNQRVQEVREASAMEVMDLVHEGWRDTVKSPEYVSWLGTQPADYQDKINNSWSPTEVRQSIKAFEQSRTTKPKAPAAPAAGDRFADAVVPRSAGGHSAVRTDDDEFLAGFRGK